MSDDPRVWRSYEPDPSALGYEGPATLLCDADLIAYEVGVCVIPEVQVTRMHEGDEAVNLVRRSWRAEVGGRPPAPPLGECLLILPDGGDSPAVLHDCGRDGTRTWRGQLSGRGPAPRPPRY